MAFASDGLVSGSPQSSRISSVIWSTVRFRRAKVKKGWVLLGIPMRLYPGVAMRLFDQQAKLIERYQEGGFVSVLFEAPPILSAKLAGVFPAPPGCEALKISASGDRVLSGKAARSANAITQAIDSLVAS